MRTVIPFSTWMCDRHWTAWRVLISESGWGWRSGCGVRRGSRKAGRALIAPSGMGCGAVMGVVELDTGNALSLSTSSTDETLLISLTFALTEWFNLRAVAQGQGTAQLNETACDLASCSLPSRLCKTKQTYIHDKYNVQCDESILCTLRGNRTSVVSCYISVYLSLLPPLPLHLPTNPPKLAVQ